MRKFMLIALTLISVGVNAQYNYKKSYTFPVFNRSTQFYLNPEFFQITISKVNILKNVRKGNTSLDSTYFLNYSTSYFNINDTCELEVVFSDTNKTVYKDTFNVIFNVLGKANTYANFYHTGKILTKEFYSYAISDSAITGVKWNFGNKTFSTKDNPVITYTKAGTYNVCLTAYTRIDSNTYCDDVVVHDTDYLELYDDYATVFFPDTAVILDVLQNDFQFKGTLSILSNGKYNSAFVKNNTIYIQSNKVAPIGYDALSYSVCKGGKCDTANIYLYQYLNYSNLTCLADFNWQENKKTVTLASAPSCKNGKGAIASIKWRLDTTSLGSKDTLVYTFKNYGFYNVCLDVIDTFGIKNSSCKSISLYDFNCYPQFSYKGKANDVEFINETFCFDIPGDSTKSYSWNFGDSNTATGFKAQHTYKAAGDYNVCLSRITDTDTLVTCKTITVYDSTSLIAHDDYFVVDTRLNPAEFGVLDNDIFYQINSIALIDSTKLGSISINNAGIISYKRINKYTYGTDTFKYVVCNKYRCDTAIGILQSGLYFIEPITACTPEISYKLNKNTVTYTAKSSCTNGKEGAYLWYFEDGSTDTAKTVIKVYDYPGYKDVKLFLIDTAGNWSFTYEFVLIVDTTLNNGCVFAQDDHFEVNSFYNTSSNVIHNDYNIDFKNARTISIQDFKHGITLLDSFGNLNWIPDSAYTGCDTMLYLVYDAKNTSCLDSGIVTICYLDLSPYCVDSTLIDTTMDCNFGYMPVCGCDKKEYDNVCEAYFKGGVNFYTNGPCSNLPPSFNLSGSSSLKTFTIYNDEVSQMPIKASDPNAGNTTTINTKLENQFNACLKTEFKNGKLICYPSTGCTGNYTLYMSACDNWGYCTIDTITINVLNKSTSGIKTSNLESFKAYPNPTSSNINLSFTKFESGDFIRIMDITGKQIGNSKTITTNNEILEMDALSTGMYYIQHLTANGVLVSVLKVSKQ